MGCLALEHGASGALRTTSCQDGLPCTCPYGGVALNPILPAYCPRSCGGVVLVSGDGRITVSNTLDDRLKIAYNGNLPEIRTKLFGAA